MQIGDKVFQGYTYVMAIINLTPDSFYPSSRATADDVLFRVEKAVKEGAAVIDLGAQSTRPGYNEISAEEEISRLAVPLERIKARFSIPVSVDTYYSECARAALSLGADMINDVTGLVRSPQIADLAAQSGAALCIMHNSSSPVPGDPWQSVLPFLERQSRYALSRGVSKDKIILDGGIGFAKDRRQNFLLVQDYQKISSLGFPSLIGVSRKSMFGGRVEQRLAPTVQVTELMAKKKVLFVRVHDVRENVLAIERAYNGGI